MSNRKIIGAVAMTAALAGGGAIGATIGYPAVSGAQDAPTTTTTPSTSATPESRPDGAGFRGGRGPDLEVAAKALGITAEELRTELKAGKSIAEVATEKGVDKQEVIDALVAAGEKRLDEAKTNLPDVMAKIVDGTFPADGGQGGRGGRGERGGPGGRGFEGGQGGEAAAKALGMTTDELRTELKAGKSIAEVATEKGVDKQKVIDAMVTEAGTRLDEAVTAGRLTQAEADEKKADLATRIADRIDETPGDRGDRGEGLPADGGN